MKQKKMYVLLAVVMVTLAISYSAVAEGPRSNNVGALPVAGVPNGAGTTSGNSDVIVPIVSEDVQTDDEQIVAVPNGAGVTEKVSSDVSTLSLAPFRTYTRANYVTDGIGVRNTGRGTISLRVPEGRSLTDAWIYWKVINSVAGTHDKEITVNGIKVTGTMIGTGPSPCWSNNGYTYRANIKSVLYKTSTKGGDFGITVGGMSTKVTNGTGAWNLYAIPAVDDVAAVIIFSDPTGVVTIFDGYAMVAGGIATFGVPAGTRMYSSIIADGQVVGTIPYMKSVNYNNGVTVTTLQNVTLNGVDPSITSRATYQGSLSDTDTFILPSPAPAGSSLTWSLDGDCVAFDTLIFSSATVP